MVNLNQGSTNLYNGNIRNIVTSIDGMSTMGTAYKYDQLQRLKEMNAYYMSSSTTNDWINSTHTDEYFNSYIYDRNGNITDLKRNGNTTTGLAMDDFVYKYDETLHGGYNNRLSWVDDGAGASIYADQDIDNSMNAGNYDYDKLGQLTMDIDEGIDEIIWRKGDKKIKKIIRSITKPDASEVEFIYNPFGQRIVKIVKPRNGGALSAEEDWMYNYYAYDANGQVMAIYEVQKSTTNNKATLEERNIYGAGRIGILKSQIVLFDNGNYPQTGATIVKNTLGNRQYEITNHLGNVNVVITDRKTVDAGGLSSIYVATKVMTSDYYPFGMSMIGDRHHEYTSEGYRFGYNGMEKDKEIKGDGNSYTTEFRQYDPRLGRWLSLDPCMDRFPWMSPYVGMDNNPVKLTDPKGLYTKWKEARDARKSAKASGQFEQVGHIKRTGGKRGEKTYYFKTKEKGGDYIDPNTHDEDLAQVDVTIQTKKTEFEKEEEEHGIFYTSPTDLANNPEWLQQRAKCASVDKLFETLFWEGTMLLTGEEIGNAMFNGVKWLYKAHKARKALKAGEEIIEEGVSVLGHYPEYVKLADKINAKRFQIPKKIWDKMTSAEQWAANVKFLDRMIARGDKIRLATPVNKVNPGSYLEKELNYLMGKGYKVSDDGKWLIK